MRTTKEVFVKILGSAIIIAIFATIIIYIRESEVAKPITITIRILEDEDMIKYKSNLYLIADEKCNEDWQQLGYRSKDYSANIICKDKTEIDLDFQAVMSYMPVNKKK